MGLLANDHGQGRRAEEAVGFHIPPQPIQHRRAGRRQTRKAGHGGPADEGGATARRHVEQFHQPALRDFFEARGDGAGRKENRILVPRPGQPVGGQRRGQTAAVHESKEAAARAGDRGRGPNAVQEIEHSFGIGGTFGKGLVQDCQAVQRLPRGRHRASIQPPQVPVCLHSYMG